MEKMRNRGRKVEEELHVKKKKMLEESKRKAKK